MKKDSNKLLFNNVESLRELNILVKITQSIIGTLDHEEVLQIISDGMSELLGIESAAIYLLKDNENLLLSATTPALPPEMPLSLRKALIQDHPHIKKAVETHRHQLITDTKNAMLSPAEKNVVELRNLRSLLYLPFVQNETVLGVLILGTCNSSHIFSDSEIEFGQTIANQLSMAIQNTLLHADLNNYKVHLEELVNEKTKELDAAIEELKSSNDELSDKNNIINDQNMELKATLNYLKQTQAELFRAEKMASLGTLTAGVAHEINNPLNFIMGATTGLEDYFAKHKTDNELNIDLLIRSLKTGIERISNIVHGLNQFNRENQSFNEQCCIHSIIDNCLVMLENQIKYKIQIKKQYYSHPIIVKGNIGKLHQVLLNLLTNAVQAIEDKGLIQIKTNQESEQLAIIEIIDSGVGIKKEFLNKITDPFFTTKSPGKGTGLGLTITYNIIQEHNGEIEFKSKPGKGTTVKVILPLYQH